MGMVDILGRFLITTVFGEHVVCILQDIWQTLDILGQLAGWETHQYLVFKWEYDMGM